MSDSISRCDALRQLAASGAGMMFAGVIQGRGADIVGSEWMKIAMTWRDAGRRLTLRLAPGSRLLPPNPRRFVVRVAGTTVTKSIEFAGQPVDVRFQTLTCHQPCRESSSV